ITFRIEFAYMFQLVSEFDPKGDQPQSIDHQIREHEPRIDLTICRRDLHQNPNRKSLSRLRS
ncbi:MAG: hypothetical protein MJH10_19730, partial [Epibacterium sp.]|nr:hypothetical protein [Epibacterium sp.]